MFLYLNRDRGVLLVVSLRAIFCRLKSDKRGQTFLEYLLLMAAAFLTSYLVITGPLSTFTRTLLTDIRNGLSNVVEHAEWTSESIEPGKGKHPGNPERLKAVHL